MKKWVFIIDVEKCENCNNCFLACKDEFVNNEWPGYSAPQPDHGHKWINISTNERGQYPFIDVAYLPQPCMHCENAPCIKAAKDNAVYRRPDGIVIIDPVKAKGQKAIITACPYDAVWWNEKLELPQKCSFCAHLLDKGWTKPRCVQSCPTGALSVKNLEDVEIQQLIKDEKLEVYHPERKTNPGVYYKNLYRFTRCFIGGSIATKIDGKNECAEGAKVSLLNADGNRIADSVTDNYGDFKFDDLPENSGQYTIRIIYRDGTPRDIAVELKKSVNIGIIYV